MHGLDMHGLDGSHGDQSESIAVGPWSLVAAFGVAEYIADPVAEMHQGSSLQADRASRRHEAFATLACDVVRTALDPQAGTSRRGKSSSRN